MTLDKPESSLAVPSELYLWQISSSSGVSVVRQAENTLYRTAICLGTVLLCLAVKKPGDLQLLRKEHHVHYQLISAVGSGLELCGVRTGSVRWISYCISVHACLQRAKSKTEWQNRNSVAADCIWLCTPLCTSNGLCRAATPWHKKRSIP